MLSGVERIRFFLHTSSKKKHFNYPSIYKYGIMLFLKEVVFLRDCYTSNLVLVFLA